MTKEEFTKRYGLVGKTIKARLKSGNNDRYNWNGTEVPIKILGEYPTFLAGMVLPHKNPKGWGMSTPYRITIHKHDIYSGEMIINGGAVT